ncbi:MAG: hypothetical protein ACRDY3_08775, partial [Acidimicrobiales bacterium]
PQGTAGPRGAVGPKGAPGPRGPAGTIVGSKVLRPASKSTAPGAAAGTVLVQKMTCPPGKVLLGGGAQVSANGVLADRKVELRSSFPLTTRTWQVVAEVTHDLGPGKSMTLAPYLLCGTR